MITYFFSGSVLVDQTDICSALYCTGLDSLVLCCLCGFKPVPVKCKKVQRYGYVRVWKAEPTCFCTQSHCGASLVTIITVTFFVIAALIQPHTHCHMYGNRSPIALYFNTFNT